MRRARVLPLAAWDFVVGEDWRTAIGVAVALAVTALVAGAGVSAWWVLPVAVLGLLVLSVRRAARETIARQTAGGQPQGERRAQLDRCGARSRSGG